ncbi:MAG: M20/M25/M40 family metallo-hydrolase, partial [Rubrivivax sp.]
MLKRIVLGLLALVGLAVIGLAANALRQGSRQIDVPPLAPLALDVPAIAASLGAAVRARTISLEEGGEQAAPAFAALHAHLQARYPLVFAQLTPEVVGGHSLLFTWQGSEPGAKPIGLMAHQDVVPIAPGTEGDWQQPPFSGVIEGGFVWGRGAWDDKGNLIAELEAVERLLADGFKPRRTVYLMFGHDEEIGGQQGAAQIAALLQQRGIKLDFVLDEGLLIISGVLPGLDVPAAAIGIAEKGYLTVKLSVPAA